MEHKCPTCDREFEELKNFPLIYIDSFERIKLPEYIRSNSGVQFIPEKVSKRNFIFWKKQIDNPSIPSEVLRAFREEGKDVVSYNGNIYEISSIFHLRPKMNHYEVSEDLIKVVKEAIQQKQVQEPLSFLETSIKQEIDTRTLVAKISPERRFALGDGNKWNMIIEKYNDLSLSLDDCEAEKEGIRTCVINLIGGWGSGSIRFPSFRQSLAQFNYEGRLKK